MLMEVNMDHTISNLLVRLGANVILGKVPQRQEEIISQT